MMPVVRRIQDAVLAIKERGMEIHRGMWGVRWNHKRERWEALSNGVSALGALILYEQPGPLSVSEWGTASEMLQVDVPWVTCFHKGFCQWAEHWVMSFPPYRLGAWFAVEYADDLNRLW